MQHGPMRDSVRGSAWHCAICLMDLVLSLASRCCEQSAYWFCRVALSSFLNRHHDTWWPFHNLQLSGSILCREPDAIPLPESGFRRLLERIFRASRRYYFNAPSLHMEVVLQRRQRRSPAHALGNSDLQIKHLRTFSSTVCSRSEVSCRWLSPVF
jgi:hypothetical protein